MVTVEEQDDGFASDGTRLKGKLNNWAESAGKPAVFRVIADAANLSLTIRYQNFNETIDDQRAQDLLTKPDSLGEFARRFVRDASRSIPTQ